MTVDNTPLFSDLDGFQADRTGEYETTSIGDMKESIDTNLWLADAYDKQGAAGLRDECLKAAWYEYTRYKNLLDCYCGSALGDRVRAEVVKHNLMEAL